MIDEFKVAVVKNKTISKTLAVTKRILNTWERTKLSLLQHILQTKTHVSTKTRPMYSHSCHFQTSVTFLK